MSRTYRRHERLSQERSGPKKRLRSMLEELEWGEDENERYPKDEFDETDQSRGRRFHATDFRDPDEPYYFSGESNSR